MSKRLDAEPQQPEAAPRMQSSPRPFEVNIVVVALLFIAALEAFGIARGTFSAGTASASSLPPALFFIDPLLVVLITYGYWKLKKWSVILLAIYVALGVVLPLLSRTAGIRPPSIAVILILLSMGNQWRCGTLS